MHFVKLFRCLFGALFIFSCAFFQGEREAEVLLETKPEGAYIYKIYTRHMASGNVVNENSQFIGQTPIVIKIPKNAQAMVVFAKEGHKNKEFIIRTSYSTVFMDDGKSYTSCTNESYYAWMTGNIYNKIVKFLAPNLQEQYCGAARYQYKLTLEKL